LKQLAEKYSPILCYHQDEGFFVSNVEAFLDYANYIDPNSYHVVSYGQNLSKNLPVGHERSYVSIDLLAIAPKYAVTQELEKIKDWYKTAILAHPQEYPMTVYYHIRDEDRERYAYITYWFFYVFNDFANNHQGDWEGIILELDKNNNYEVRRVGASAHILSFYEPWGAVRKDQATGRPLIFVGRGSHGSYFSRRVWGWYVIEHVGSLIDPDRPKVKKLYDALKFFFSFLFHEYVSWRFLRRYESKMQVTTESEGYIILAEESQKSKLTVTERGFFNGLKSRKAHYYELVQLDPKVHGWLEFKGEWGHPPTPDTTMKKLQYLFDIFGERGPRGPRYKLRWNNPHQWFTFAFPYDIFRNWGWHAFGAFLKTLLQRWLGF
jgi:hypothetical protein